MWSPTKLNEPKNWSVTGAACSGLGASTSPHTSNTTHLEAMVSPGPVFVLTQKEVSTRCNIGFAISHLSYERHDVSRRISKPYSSGASIGD
jgi:hypothetical protein